MSTELEIGWFGKLPCSGDFVSRRIPRTLLDALDSWLSHGIAEFREAIPADWRATFARAPAWNCAIPACISGGTTLIGLLVPSRDRVGREFPLCAGVALAPEDAAGQLLADAHGWLWGLGERVVEARDRALPLDEFDAKVQAIALPRSMQGLVDNAGGGEILGIIGLGPMDAATVPMPLAHAVPWPELPMIFDSGKPTSYWWTNVGAGEALSGFTTDAGLVPSLFTRLMTPTDSRTNSCS